jgi:hypothetical protein
LFCQTLGGRPIAGQVNVGPDTDSTSIAALTSTLKHEILHSLGFGTYTNFRDSNGNVITGVTETFNDVFNGVTVTRNKYLLQNAINAARIQYNCPTLSYLLLEEFGSSGTAGAHCNFLYKI